MRRFTGVLCPLLLLVAISGTLPYAWSQEVTAAIVGTVVDPSNAPINNAKVTATDTARGTVYQTETNESGAYNINRVPIGTYELRVTAQGFQTAAHSAFTLVLNQTARIDVQMKVGQVSETVEVTSSAPILKTESTQVDTIIDAKTNDQLPLASRNYVQLTLLAPGAVTPNPDSFNNGDNTANGGRPYINGNREQANNFVLDGIDNNQVSDNLVGFTPAPDAIEEFNLITQNASAEFGNYQGGIVNATIKSGTNGFHGDVWEYFRNDVLNANKWENGFKGPDQALPKDKLRWNMNRGKGRFEETGTFAGVAYSTDGRARSGMGLDSADFNQDGWMDLFVANIDMERFAIYQNNHDGSFDDQAAPTGIGMATRLLSGWGLKFFDYDNDGFLDLFLANGNPDDLIESIHSLVKYQEPLMLFHGTGKGFVNVSAQSGPLFAKPLSARGMAIGDFDNDGATDVLVANNDGAPILLRNNVGSQNHWLGLKLVGTKSNPDAIGARITYQAQDLKQQRMKVGGGSFLSSHDPRIVLGIGKRTKIDWLEIKWPLPSDKVERFTDLPVDRYIRIFEGAGSWKQ